MTIAIKINANDGVKRNIMTGGETEVDFDFPIFEAEHIEIYETNAAGVIALLVKDTDYSVPAGSVNQQAGGTVTLDVGVYPSGATATHVFTAYQAAPYSRITDFAQAGDFLADTMNKELDLFAQQSQQIRRDLARALLAPVDTAITAFSLPAPVDDTVLAWDGVNGAVKIGPTVATIEAAAGEAVDAAASAAAALVSENAADASDVSAAASAAAAASSAAEGLYNNVITLTDADSPYVPTALQEGTMFRLDMTSGVIVVNLSALSVYAEDMTFAFVKVDASANAATINRGGTDTISGSTSLTLATQYETNVIVGDSATGTWINTVQSTTLDINGLAADATPDGAADYLISYDASAGTNKKVLMDDLPAASGGGLVLLATVSASSSSSVDFTSFIDSTYDVYFFTWSDVISSATAVLQARLGNGGSFDSGASDYKYAKMGLESNDTAPVASASLGFATHIDIGSTTASSTTTSAAYHGHMYMYGASNASEFTQLAYNTTFVSQTPRQVTTVGTGSRFEEAAHDRLQFLFSTGNIASGEFKLYGIAKS